MTDKELIKKYKAGERNFAEANLTGANLTGADLCGVNFTGANLSGADLTEADLSGANLTGADLRGADLCGADLCGADLRCADLRCANLSEADFQYANLSNNGIKTISVTPCASKDRITAVQGTGLIGIGCEDYSIKYWLEHYKEIGQKNKYTPEEIEIYGRWIRIIAEEMK